MAEIRCDRCSESYDDSAPACPSCGMPAPGVSEEDVLMTGMWRSMGTLLAEAQINLAGAEVPEGVRLRRVGGEVEIEPDGPDVGLTVDGEAIAGTVRVVLSEQRVEVGGVRITEEMIPVDVLTSDELPEFFAPIVIGRSPDCDFVVQDRRCSGRHACLTREAGALQVEDLDSANGVFIAGQRVKRSPVHWRQPFQVGTQVLTPLEVYREVRTGRVAASTSILSAMDVNTDRRGGPNLAGADRADLAAMLENDQGGATAAVSEFRDGVPLVVGRGEDADIVIDSPNVSRHHARLTKVSDGIMVEDLGATNGTWVNGRRIVAPTMAKLTDDIRVGGHKLVLSADGVATDTEERVHGVRVDVRDVSRDVGDPKRPIRVVDSVGFTILPGEMVAVMGPSGAGKTSVITTLAGYTPPSEGQILMDGLSLYDHYDVFRNAVGYVPQEDVMHRILTVEEVLYYQAKLNFPDEVGDDEIQRRITRVLEQLDLVSVRTSLVGDEVRRGLSGGQRKRLNVAMELLSEPALLVLDEPTSGLDARSASELIAQCRKLATVGRTVVMTIHQPRQEAFELFDKLLLLTKGGKVAYYGSVEGARAYFTERSEVPAQRAANPADYVLDALDPVEEFLAHEPKYWKDHFRGSSEFNRFVGQRQQETEISQAQEQSHGGGRTAGALRQTWWLTHRYARLKLRDRGALLVQLAQAPVIALLAVLLFHEGRYWPIRLQDDVTPTLFVLVAAAVWFGISNVAREIVGERAVFRRERMGSLRPGPYLLSKMAVQGLLIFVQVAILLGVLIPAIPLQGGIAGLVGVALLAGWSAMSLGLLISAVAPTEMAAIQYVPLVILPQIMLSGVLVPVAGKSVTVMASLLSKPILLRWAYGASLHVEFAAGTVRGDKSRSLVTGGQYWQQIGFGADSLTTDVGVMAGMAVVCAAATWIILLRRDRR